MEIHTLHPLLGLHLDERRARGNHRNLPLLDEPEIGASHFELRLHQAERLLIVGQRLRQDLFTLARGDLGGQGTFHLSEGT